jgi:hypothetical protein
MGKIRRIPWGASDSAKFLGLKTVFPLNGVNPLNLLLFFPGLVSVTLRVAFRERAAIEAAR